MKRIQEYKDDLKRIGWYLLCGLGPPIYLWFNVEGWDNQVATVITFCFLIYKLFKKDK